MSEDFFKFPSTPHLANLGSKNLRGDKVLTESERADFLKHTLYVEEKIDGANLGISFDCNGNIFLQNRGSVIASYEGQWKKLGEWLKSRADAIFDVLENKYVMFGEWCYARHSVKYDKLPDIFLGFDIYDKDAAEFLNTEARDQKLAAAGVHIVPFLGRGRFTLESLQQFFGKSSFGDVPNEGVYLRIDDGTTISGRAKLVCPAFVQNIDTHWRNRTLERNLVNHP